GIALSQSTVRKEWPAGFRYRIICYSHSIGSRRLRSIPIQLNPAPGARFSGRNPANEVPGLQCARCGGFMTMVHPPMRKSPTVSSPFGPAPSITTPLPGPNAQKLIDRDEKFSSPSYTRDYPLVVKRALGSVVEDVDG